LGRHVGAAVTGGQGLHAFVRFCVGASGGEQGESGGGEDVRGLHFNFLLDWALDALKFAPRLQGKTLVNRIAVFMKLKQ
jgi:hypothetical protein